MLNGSGFSVDGPSRDPDCPFCNRGELSQILHETTHFILAADHAPLVEGHLLIIPKDHFACYGEVPVELDDELFALKQTIGEFFTCFYDPPVFWEHGIFKQTVFHAHLHCFPWGITGYTPADDQQGAIVRSQNDIRRWYVEEGHYFYLEDPAIALLFPPIPEQYMRIVHSVFLRGMSLRGGKAELHPPQQRIAEGGPLIQAVMERWALFQQQGVTYANESSTR